MNDLRARLGDAVSQRRYLAGRSLPTGIETIDELTGGLRPGALVVVVSADTARDRLARQLVIEAAGRGRRTVLVTPFETANPDLERTLLMATSRAYGLTAFDSQAGAGDHSADALNDLAEIADQIPLEVLGVDGGPSAQVPDLSDASAPVELLAVLDVDVAPCDARRLIAGQVGEEREVEELPFDLRRLGRVKVLTVLVTMSRASFEGDPGWSRAADTVFTLTDPDPLHGPSTTACLLDWSDAPSNLKQSTVLAVGRGGWLHEPTRQPANKGADSLFSEPQMRSRRRQRMHARAIAVDGLGRCSVRDGFLELHALELGEAHAR